MSNMIKYLKQNPVKLDYISIQRLQKVRISEFQIYQTKQLPIILIPTYFPKIYQTREPD